MDKTPYEILGINATASQSDIKDAYRALAKKFHPDLNPGNKVAEKNFKEINGAYELVGTPEARAQYDQGQVDQARSQAEAEAMHQRRGPFYHQTQQDNGRYSQSFENRDDDLLQSILGRMGGVRGGQDVLYKMDIDFKDAALGAEREITLPTGKRLRVKIPAGVSSGSKLRFAGHGSAGAGGGSAGDAYVELKVLPSTVFQRHDNDIEVELPLSFSEAILGAEVKVPTIDGSVMLKVPPGVSTGSKLRVAGKGIPLANGKRGDQYVVLKIVMPAKVDSELKQAVDAWSKREEFNPRLGWIGFNERGL